MKKTIRFSRLFVPAVILSVALIGSGVFSFVTRGFNLALDFKAGFIEEVRIGDTALSLTYVGASSVTVLPTSQGVSIVTSGVGTENNTAFFAFSEYPTVGDLAEGFDVVSGVTAVLSAPPQTPSNILFINSQSSNLLSTVPYRFHYVAPDAAVISIDTMRDTLSDISGVSVKVLGNEKDNSFQIRVGDDGSVDSGSTIKAAVSEALLSHFGSDSIAVVKTDFIAAQFSKSLGSQAVLMVLASLGLIWVYAAIRFRWDFAIGAILAIIHDALIMIAFITWSQIEFSTITLAAVLTIIGYSINDTVVVFDRIRENIKTLKVPTFKEVLDISQTEILSRTIITTFTTLLAVVSLFIFTSGSMKDFALALIVGMISGVYSTIFIAGAFIAVARKNWKHGDDEKKKAQPAVLQQF